jgi:uncharacterized protein
LIHYYDASALVKRYVQEPGSERVASLLLEGIAATARYTHLEILSALARRLRQGDLAVADHRYIETNLRRDFEKLVAVELTAEVIREAERLLAGHALRAGDAVQLASCIVLQARTEVPVTFVAFDERCNHAARAEGLHLFVE